MSTALAAGLLGDDGVVNSATEVHGHNHQQHGGTEGHIAPTSENVRLVGKMRINQNQEGRVADVGIFGNYAYLGAFYEPSCQKGGVYVFDITNPAAPKQINFIRTSNDAYVGEGVQVIHIDTPAYNGDVLAMNNEVCQGNAGNTNQRAAGGLSLVDVTNPKVHKFLSQHVGDLDPANPAAEAPGTAHQIHSAFMWDAGDKAYAVTVDNEDLRDVDIMDISDPRKPVLIAEYDLIESFPAVRDQLGQNETFHHDVIVKQMPDGRFHMLISYWDGGYVVADVTDPRNLTYIADSDFTVPDPEAAESGLTVPPEGNAHEAEFSLDNKYIVAADEDFEPYTPRPRNTSENDEEFVATMGSATPPIDQDTAMVGQTRFVGLACPGEPVPVPGEASVALIERGTCTFTEKIASVQAAGYAGAIVFNRQGTDGCSDLLNMLVEGNIPALFVGRDVGYDLLDINGYDDAACRANTQPTPAGLVGTLGDSVNVSAEFDGWGYVHLYENNTGKLTELDTYAIPEAHDEKFAQGFGDVSVHEVAMSPTRADLAYFAYYSGGFRVAKIVNGELVEVGRFIDTGGNNFWGVQVFNRNGKEYVAASDRDFGLYIFEYTGP